MLESVITFVKTLPSWLGLVVEILTVIIYFSMAISLIMGVWLGFCLLRRRMNYIAEIQMIPPKITFYERKDNNPKQ